MEEAESESVLKKKEKKVLHNPEGKTSNRPSAAVCHKAGQTNP